MVYRECQYKADNKEGKQGAYQGDVLGCQCDDIGIKVPRGFDFIDADIYFNRKFNEELKSNFKNTEARYFYYFIDVSVKLGQFSAPNDYVTIIK